MWPWFKRKDNKPDEGFVDVWKSDFSDCATADFLPDYSVCRCENNRSCRYLAQYAGMVLCSNPAHKSFIIPGSEPFDPHKHPFKD